MEKSVFPKKFNGTIKKHCEILREEYKKIKGGNLLEIATGSGAASDFLSTDISYRGIDISRGLLLKAIKKFKAKNFRDSEFYVASAADLPFCDNYFDSAICDLSLNFLGNLDPFLKELKRVLKKESVFYCSVPIPERKEPKATIHGNLFSEAELTNMFEKYGFSFEPKLYKNGALLYFEARLTGK